MLFRFWKKPAPATAPVVKRNFLAEFQELNDRTVMYTGAICNCANLPQSKSRDNDIEDLKIITRLHLARIQKLLDEVS